jgi:hypothetical protein
MTIILRRPRSFRVFLVDESDRARRFPVKDYFSFSRQDGGVPHPELASRVVRFAEFEIDRASRWIGPARYVMVRFGSDGRPDALGTADEAGLVARAVDLGVGQEVRSSASGKLRDRYGWTPSPFQEEMLRRQVFSRPRAPVPAARPARYSATGTTGSPENSH